MEIASCVQFVSGALVLAGAPGSGRTTLLHSARAAAGERLVLEAPGHLDETFLPYAGLHRLLEPLPSVEEAGPLLHAIRGGVPGPPLAVGVALLDRLREAAAERPVLVLLDDADLLDPQSFAALAFAARRLGGAPVAVLATVPAGHPPTGLPTRVLGPLAPEAARAVLDRHAPGLPAEVAAALIDLGGGNAGTLADLARSLTPAQRRGDAPPPVALPAGSAAMARFRVPLAALPPATHDALLLAASAGPAATLALLEAAGVDAGSFRAAESAGLVRIAGPSVEFPEPVLGTVIRDAATPAARRAAHARLAGALDAEGQTLVAMLHRARAATGADPDLAARLIAAAEIADHSDASLAYEQAACLLADAAAARSARTAASTHAWLAGQPGRAARLLQGATARPAATLLGLRGRIGRDARETLLREAHRMSASGDVAATLDMLLTVGDAFAAAGEHDRYAEVARAASALRGSGVAAWPITSELAFHHLAGLSAMFTGDHPRAFAELRRPHAHHRPPLDALGPEASGPGARMLGRAAFAALLVGDGPAAADLAARSVTAARVRGALALIPGSLETAAFALLAAGRYAEAGEAAAEGATIAAATGQEPQRQTCLAVLAVLAALAGDRDGCRRHVAAADTHDTEEGPGQARALCEWALALADLVHGRPQDTVARLLAIIAGPAGHGNVVVQVAATPHLIEAVARTDAALPGVDQIVAPFDMWAGRTGRPSWLALRERCRALRSDDAATAERHFQEALRLHRAGDADFPRAHTELLFGRELRRRRRPAAARTHLRRAAETFTLIGAGPWAEQAGRELRAAGETGGETTAAYAVSLTAQQERIARLVAEGATNREIAEQMFLSTRTVDHHLRNVFARLGVRSRTELARLIPAGPA